MPTYKTGNFLEDTWDILVFTANGFVKNNGELAMGKGAAKAVKDKYPHVAISAGTVVQEYGIKLENSIYKYGLLQVSKNPKIFALQVKYHFNDFAKLHLIEMSINKLIRLAEEYKGYKIALNYPGIGYGKLDITQVGPIVRGLPKNVYVYTLPSK